MARKIREKDADIIYDDDLVDMIDDKLESEPVVKSSYEEDTDSALDEAFDSLSIDDYITDSKDTTKVAPVVKQKRQEPIRTKPSSVKNPFEGQEEDTKPTYNDIVDDDYVAPRMDVRPYTPIPAKKSKKRFKLWLVTGICGVCLLAAATMIGVLGIGAGAGTNALGRNNVETGELASDEGIINKTDSNLTEEQVKDWLSGGKNLPKNVSNGKTNNSLPESDDVITNSSLWDKICNFFSHMFGR